METLMTIPLRTNEDGSVVYPRILKMKKTKQGVRDLSHIKSKPRGRILPPVPVGASGCKHLHVENNESTHFLDRCTQCGTWWDCNGGVIDKYST